jgi:hypothetical protein
MSQHFMLIVQFHPEHCIGQQFLDYARKLNQIFLRHSVFPWQANI